jgi:hypothetical protein
MKLKDINFREIPFGIGYLSVFDGDAEIAFDSIGRVLKALTAEYAEREVKSTNYYFEAFVVRL